jgi:hypothetical protein
MAEQLIRYGRFSLLYEDGFIRYISIGNFEIIRKIYFALRDTNWVTAEFTISNHKIDSSDSGFNISYTATNKVAGKDVFRWKVNISGNEAGEIDFSIDGNALAEYTRNRAGICVLHPINETLGKDVLVTKPDGSQYDSVFHGQIAPHQPFLHISKFRWKLEDEAWAELEFEGDIFETEDQRNWSDTSFKTYSTPLSIPFPVKLKTGDRITQRVKLRLTGADLMKAPALADEVNVSIIEGEKYSFPLIGTEFSGTAVKSLSDKSKLRELGFSHIRIELDLSGSAWQSKLSAGIEEADAIDSDIFLHLVFGPSFEDQWKAFKKLIGPNVGGRVKKLAISPSDRKGNVNRLLEYLLSAARQVFPESLIGAGFVSYFTELNRNRFDYSGLDFIIYSVNPQVHAHDTNTVIENLPAQWYAVKSANALSDEIPVHVGPVSLRPRFNPDAKPGSVDQYVGLPYRFDLRQISAMAAGWMLASLKYLGESGAVAITMMEAHGMAGYFIAEADQVHKDFKFADPEFPVYRAMQELRGISPKWIVKSMSDQPRYVTSMIIEGEPGRVIVLINHRDVNVSVRLGDTSVQLSPYESKFIPV